MTDEEVEVVAEELAKIGGTAWYPGRGNGPLVRVVTDRYRERARAIIAALDSMRGGNRAVVRQDFQEHTKGSSHTIKASAPSEACRNIQPGATVIYRPPGDRRTYPCRVVEIRGSQAYLAPIIRTCIGWISIESLVEGQEEKTSEDN